MEIIFKNEDFRNAEKTDSIIISDPPYNINFKYNEYDDKKDQEEYIELIRCMKKITDKIVLIGYPEQFYQGYIPALGIPDKTIVWCYNSNISKQFRLIGFWNVECDLSKDYQPYKNPNDKRVKKLMADGKKGAKLYDWWNDIQIVKNVSKNKIGNTHPCPVPVKLMERIIKVTNGNKYIDVFNGSGTSGIAAYNQKKDFIGYEINEDYYKNSLELLEKAKK